MIFNITKLKLHDINLSIYAVEIVFETIFHGNGRNMTCEKEFHYLEKDFVSDLFFFSHLYFYLNIHLFDLNNSKLGPNKLGPSSKQTDI